MKLSRTATARALPSRPSILTKECLTHLRKWSSYENAVDLQGISTTDHYAEIECDLQRTALFSKSLMALNEVDQSTRYSDQWLAQKHLLGHQTQAGFRRTLSEFLDSPAGFHTKQFVWAMLPPLNPSRLQGIIKSCKWSPGSNLSTSSGMVTPEYKQFGRQSVTVPAKGYAFLDFFWNLWPSLRRVEILEPRIRAFIQGGETRAPANEKLLAWYTYLERTEFVRHERFSTVPKTSTKDRPICIGASLNVRLQLGVHEYLSRQLRREGIDISDQTRNQRMAREGSEKKDFFRNFGTIDLSAASDSVTTALLRGLLPNDWFNFLDDLRHHTVVDPKSEEVIAPARFSGMGNGFTFALETLIFAAIVRGACKAQDMPLKSSDFSVYGDDIIAPTMYCDTIVTALQKAGFSVNTEKSFWQGDYRESCGHDYYRGRFIRPFHIRSGFETNADLYTALNEAAVRIELSKNHGGCPKTLCRIVRLLLSLVKGRCLIVPNTDCVPSYSGIYNGNKYGRIRSLTSGLHRVLTSVPRDFPLGITRNYRLRLLEAGPVFSFTREDDQIHVTIPREPQRFSTRRGATKWRTQTVAADFGRSVCSPLDVA